LALLAGANFPFPKSIDFCEACTHSDTKTFWYFSLTTLFRNVEFPFIKEALVEKKENSNHGVTIEEARPRVAWPRYIFGSISARRPRARIADNRRECGGQCRTTAV
jgi:hypothetical protein